MYCTLLGIRFNNKCIYRLEIKKSLSNKPSNDGRGWTVGIEPTSPVPQTSDLTTELYPPPAPQAWV